MAAGDLLQLRKYKVTPFEGPSQSIEWPAVSESRSLTVNTNAVVAVLLELTLAASNRAGGRPLRAALQVTADGAVSLHVREPANDKPLSADLIEQSARFIAANGGRLEHTRDPATGEWLTTLTFGERQTSRAISSTRRSSRSPFTSGLDIADTGTLQFNRNSRIRSVRPSAAESMSASEASRRRSAWTVLIAASRCSGAKSKMASLPSGRRTSVVEALTLMDGFTGRRWLVAGRDENPVSSLDGA